LKKRRSGSSWDFCHLPPKIRRAPPWRVIIHLPRQSCAGLGRALQPGPMSAPRRRPSRASPRRSPSSRSYAQPYGIRPPLAAPAVQEPALWEPAARVPHPAMTLTAPPAVRLDRGCEASTRRRRAMAITDSAITSSSE
jgi:hypothetical protein